MRKWMTWLFALAIGACLGLAGTAEAKGKKDVCRKADLRLALTGQGDADGDGVSDCREARYLKTDPENPDTDDDGLEDGDDFGKSCDPRDEDTDDDGLPDGEDPTPVVTQKLTALLDALTCPTAEVPETSPFVPGSISGLGTTAILDADTRFFVKRCEDLAAVFAEGEGNLLVQVRIVENSLGELHATSVLPLRGCRRPDHLHGWGWGWGHGEDDDDEDDDDDQGEDDDD